MEYLRARIPSKAEAAELQIPMTIPVLVIVRVGRSAMDNEPVEVTECKHSDPAVGSLATVGLCW
jgi:GntR family transcriptional regulator